ncbi:MAG: type II secretion system protein GspK, partial [Deltaproteobacteria bacterium]|nr:type II secretion system protein GspK [Deltaproteobacteria bacterium]
VGRRQRAGDRGPATEGSVLVMVLWLLVLISFLAGQYLAHNREKADIAQNAWTSFRQKQAVSSVVQLFSTESWPLSGETGADGHWFRLFPDDMQLWIRVDKESQRVNLNTAADGEIKQKTALMMGDNFQRETDAVSDCILDWRDTDSLTRMHGAEEKDYQAKGLSYRPANGPFNVMSELLLVMGVTPGLFWGDPIEMIATDLSKYYIQSGNEVQTRIPKTLSEGFTIYSGESKRISLLVPGSETGYLYMNIFMAKDKESGRLAVVDSLQFMGVAEAGFDRLVELESEARGLGARGKKRS